MKNLNAHFESVVKDELAAKARALGIDKDEVEYALGGNGAMGMIVRGQGQADVMPRWTVALTLRHKLLGYAPLGNGVGIPGVRPPDEQFRQAVGMVLESLNQTREQEFSGQPVQQ